MWYTIATMSSSLPLPVAQQMATLAHTLRGIIEHLLAAEPEHGPLHQQFAAFRTGALPTLSRAEFADMYAQTLVCLLFAAHYYDGTNGTPYIPHDAQHEASIAHLYETFLAAYNPTARATRGVYDTPAPIVAYIVRSTDSLLRTALQQPAGLADEHTTILDPATGTAPFLHAVIEHIYQAHVAQGQAEGWPNYAAHHLLPRLVGFEVLLAPYTIAQLRLRLLLARTGAMLQSGERLAISLTNALEHNTPLVLNGGGEAAHPHATSAIVVLGNPPYAGHSANQGAWIDGLLRGRAPDNTRTASYYEVDGEPLRERNSKWLQDDYVKFMRLGQWHITSVGTGVMAFVSNNGYLDNPTFRGMRQSLLHDFDAIYILNLHGNAMQKERTPQGQNDENVFDIQQGITIGLFVRQPGDHPRHATTYYADLWGSREHKYATLAREDVSTTHWQRLTPPPPWYRFVPEDAALQAEYEQGWRITDIMPLHGVGITTARDALVIHYEAGPLLANAHHFQASTLSDEALCREMGIPMKKGWNIANARRLIQHETDLAHYIRPILYRPFDTRLIFYHDSLVWRTVKQIMHHMLAGDNIGLMFMRQVALQGSYSHFGVSQMLVDNRTFYSNRGIMSYAPLYCYSGPHQRTPNLAPAFVAALEQCLELRFLPDGHGDLQQTVGPEDILHYIYAIFHSPTYRQRYGDCLKTDFPRVPLTSDRALFARLAQRGAHLVDLHLLRHVPSADTSGVQMTGRGNGRIEKITYHPPQRQQPGRVSINTTQSLVGIAPEVWAMQVGGYQPLAKWLKERRGRIVSSADIVHYQRMEWALRETQQIMVEIDRLIPAWPLVSG